ncbi:MAG: ribosome maturation factor RimP [Hyphomonadaceae bacterium]|nr:ribosome maturation factor RimP [Hyphomonadaceae bacterium]
MRATNPAEERVIALAEPEAEALGYRLVRVRLMGNRRKTLQIMAERVSDGEFNSEDCRKLARALGEPLEPIEYENLEVSSPGIDRPLMRIEDFTRFMGHEAKLETTAMVEGRKRFKGQIAGVEGDVILLKTAEGEFKLRFSALNDARLVLTDQLIEEDLRRAKAAEKDEEKRTQQ